MIEAGEGKIESTEGMGRLMAVGQVEECGGQVVAEAGGEVTVGWGSERKASRAGKC